MACAPCRENRFHASVDNCTCRNAVLKSTHPDTPVPRDWDGSYVSITFDKNVQVCGFHVDEMEVDRYNIPVPGTYNCCGRTITFTFDEPWTHGSFQATIVIDCRTCCKQKIQWEWTTAQ